MTDEHEVLRRELEEVNEEIQIVENAIEAETLDEFNGGYELHNLKAWRRRVETELSAIR